MSATVLVGTQWGDEGKGKVTDLISGDFDVVCRYAGGANAGHTVIANGHKLALHQVPSGVMKGDLLDVFLKIDAGELDRAELAWEDDCAVSVVLTSAGYPGGYEKGKVISGIDRAEQLEGVTVYHGGFSLRGLMDQRCAQG